MKNESKAPGIVLGAFLLCLSVGFSIAVIDRKARLQSLNQELEEMTETMKKSAIDAIEGRKKVMAERKAYWDAVDARRKVYDDAIAADQRKYRSNENR